MEIWKRYKDTYYEVSNMGNIRSICHSVLKSNGTKYYCVQKILKPAKDKKGYLRFGLSINGKLVTVKAHRVVAEVFIDNIENKKQVNHINGIKTDNRVENLEWVNNSENQIHAVANGLVKHSSGNNHHKVKVSDERLLQIKKELDFGGISKREIARKYNIDRSIFRRKILNETNS